MNAPKGFGSGASAFIGGQPPQAANDTRYSLLTPEKWAGGSNDFHSPEVTAKRDEDLYRQFKEDRLEDARNSGIPYVSADSSVEDRLRHKQGPPLPVGYVSQTPVAVSQQQLQAFPGGNLDPNYNAGISGGPSDAIVTGGTGGASGTDTLDGGNFVYGNKHNLLADPKALSQQITSVLASGGPAAAATLQSDANTQKAASFSFEGMMEKALDKALESPMETFSVAAAVMAAFTDNRDEIAASTYANEMANYNKRLDPSSNFAAEWQTTYIQDKNDELNKQFAKAEADLIATMSRRGMTDSSVNSAAMSSLTSAKAELAAKFKQDAMMAYSQYQGGLIRTQIAATTGAVNAAKMASGVGGVNYQNTFKAATAAIA